jgi:hypothetical protein
MQKTHFYISANLNSTIQYSYWLYRQNSPSLLITFPFNPLKSNGNYMYRLH